MTNCLAHRAPARDLGIKGDDMPYYWVAGEIPAKRRVCFRGRLTGHQAGELRGEEKFPLLARHFRITDWPRGGYVALGRRLLFANDDVRISVVTAGDTSGPLP